MKTFLSRSMMKTPHFINCNLHLIVLSSMAFSIFGISEIFESTPSIEDESFGWMLVNPILFTTFSADVSLFFFVLGAFVCWSALFLFDFNSTFNLISLSFSEIFSLCSSRTSFLSRALNTSKSRWYDFNCLDSLHCWVPLTSLYCSNLHVFQGLCEWEPVILLSDFLRVSFLQKYLSST